jgi:hypothetical protein
MSTSGNTFAMPRWLSRVFLLFAIAALVLWMLPLFTTRPVLFPAGPNFADILVYQGRFTLYHSARFFSSRAYSAFAYPAGAAVVYRALYSTGDAIQTYLALAAATSISALAAAFLFLRRRAAAKLFPALLLLSFPLIFLVQRANIELVLWMLIVAGILAYQHGFNFAAAVCFGLAASIKLYPLILLGIFLKPTSKRAQRDLIALLCGLLAFLLATAAAISYTGPRFTLAAYGFFSGVDRFQGHYVDTVSKVEILFDHCLFSPFKYLAYLQHISPAPWRNAYYLCAAVFVLLLFLRVHTLPYLNRVLFLMAAMVCLPPVSFTYTLVHLYVPLLLLMGYLATTGTRPPRSASVALALLLFLMLPLPGFTVLASLPTGPAQACALLLLLVTCALEPWQDRSITTNL